MTDGQDLTVARGFPEPLPEHENAGALAAVDRVISAGPFAADWTSLQQYEPPLWYRDAKFGIFIHWGVFSVPAFENEWYSRNMYLEGTTAFDHHRDVYGSQREFGYKDFIPQFHMEAFDPKEWARIIRLSGAQFVVPVAEHHDGFALYETNRSRWNATLAGPHRDVFGDLAQACRDSWLVVGASSHRAEHWFFMNGGTRFDSDVLDPEYADFYGPAQREETAPNEQFLEDWMLRTIELIDSYRPQILFFDWWIESPAFASYLKRVAAYYYNRAHQWQREVVINYKWDAMAVGSGVYDIERGSVGSIRDDVWQNDTSLSRTSWGFTDQQEYKSVGDVIAELADVVAKNGNLLLNIGPKADGTIPQEEIELLLGVGRWLSTNGEAIFGSRPWVMPGEGPTRAAVGSFTDGTSPAYTGADIRFTRRHDVTGEYVFAILLARPEDGIARIRAWGRSGPLSREVREVAVLGSSSAVAWSRTVDDLTVELPASSADQVGAVVRIWLETDVVRPREDHLHG